MVFRRRSRSSTTPTTEAGAASPATSPARIVDSEAGPEEGVDPPVDMSAAPIEERDYGSLPDASPADRATLAAVAEFTMTSPERVLATCEATRHVVRHEIPGAIVECGVWRGGSSMAMARTLLDEGSDDRHLYLFDTYEGMSEPTAHDVSLFGDVAEVELATQPPDSLIWARAALEEVRANVTSTTYPADRLHFVQGRVEDTIPEHAPEQIALLRLDTDWYESTRHELAELGDRMSPGGILIIDDYGHWNGARRAVDEWVASRATPVFLARTDYTGRIAVIS